jgi:hypothetical protein
MGSPRRAQSQARKQVAASRELISVERVLRLSGLSLSGALTVFDDPRDDLAVASLSVPEKRGILGIRCIGDRFLPLTAGASEPQGAGHYR